MADLKLISKGRFFDLVIEKNDLALDDGLRTAVVISLFSDARVTPAELSKGETDLRGWWGDSLPDIEGDQIGSRLWLLQRSKQTEETRKKAIEYAKEALEWMLTDGVAESVEVQAEWIAREFLGISVTIQRPQGKLTFSFKMNWIAESERDNAL